MKLRSNNCNHGKSRNFSGQPIFNQLIKFIDKREIKKIAKQNGAERYVKKFNTYNHVIVTIFVAFEGYHSNREVLANAHKLSHLGLSYLVRRSTFAEANQRRFSQVFGDIYIADTVRLYIMDSTTISLFNDLLKGVGRNPKEGKKKGGIKVHTIIKASVHVPCLLRYSEAARHDHVFLEEVLSLSPGSIITFDNEYIDCAQYEVFTQNTI